MANCTPVVVVYIATFSASRAATCTTSWPHLPKMCVLPRGLLAIRRRNRSNSHQDNQFYMTAGQVEKWLQRHGLAWSPGHRCPGCHRGFLVVVQRKDRNWSLRCDQAFKKIRCKWTSPGRGEFFTGYHDLVETMGLIYMCCCGYSPAQQTRELDVRAQRRCGAMFEELGKISKWRLVDLFKHNIGRCQQLQVDEAYAGKRKYHRGACPRSRGGQWYLSVVSTTGDARRRARFFLFESIPGGSGQRPNGGYRCAAHLCWHVERLAAWGAEVRSWFLV